MKLRKSSQMELVSPLFSVKEGGQISIQTIASAYAHAHVSINHSKAIITALTCCTQNRFRHREPITVLLRGCRGRLCLFLYTVFLKERCDLPLLTNLLCIGMIEWHRNNIDWSTKHIVCVQNKRFGVL